MRDKEKEVRLTKSQNLPESFHGLSIGLLSKKEKLNLTQIKTDNMCHAQKKDKENITQK